MNLVYILHSTKLVFYIGYIRLRQVWLPSQIQMNLESLHIMPAIGLPSLKQSKQAINRKQIKNMKAKFTSKKT
jgi:hypothetical protein